MRGEGEVGRGCLYRTAFRKLDLSKVAFPDSVILTISEKCDHGTLDAHAGVPCGDATQVPGWVIPMCHAPFGRKARKKIAAVLQ